MEILPMEQGPGAPVNCIIGSGWTKEEGSVEKCMKMRGQSNLELMLFCVALWYTRVVPLTGTEDAAFERKHKQLSHICTFHFHEFTVLVNIYLDIPTVKRKLSVITLTGSILAVSLVPIKKKKVYIVYTVSHLH